MPETRDIDKLSEHERARLVPAMPRDEYRAFLADVRARGIVDPIDVTQEDIVLDGRHRLRAARELGLERVPVRVVEPRDEVEHILLAAISRRQLNSSQRAALAVELREHLERVARARRRQRANLKQVSEVATLPPRCGRTRDAAAALAGVSARTVQDVESVRQANPALFEAIKRGRVPAHTAARRVRQARRDRQLVAPPLPSGRFEVLYADPPWQLGNPTSAYAPENHYPTLPLEQIKALQPPAAEQAVLFLWAVSSRLPQALAVIDAWGFEYKTTLVWVKDWIGLGTWVRHRHELLLIARRGRYPAPDPEDRPDSVIEAPRGRHSEKPACVYELIERMYPHASKLELYGRGSPPPGWVVWGNEVAA